MALTFALRGNSLTPLYAYDPRFAAYGAGVPSVIADAGAIGGYAIDQGVLGALGQQRLHFGGIGNWSSVPSFSVLLRFYHYSAATSISLFSCVGGGRQGTFGQAAFQVSYDSTNLKIGMGDENALTGIASATFAHGGLSSATYYDLFITGTGDTTSSGFKVYLNSSLLGSTTASRAWSNPREKIHNALILGQCANAPNTYMRVNEFCLWDSIEDPTAILLESGSGSLNGASRTSFVAASAYNGLASSGGGLKRINNSYFGV